MKITEIKKDAKIKLTGNYFKCCSSSLLYFLLVTLITFLQSLAANKISNSIVLALVQAIFLLISWIFSYGIISNLLELVDIKTNSITDFINIALLNSVKTTKIGFRIIIKILAPLLIFIFSLLFWAGTYMAKINKTNFLCFNKDLVLLATCILIGAFIVFLYFIIKYSLVDYTFYNNPEMTEKDIVEKSKKLMKGNLLKYVGLLLSFFHWFLIGALILLVLNIFIESRFLTPFMIFFYSLLRPYIVVSKQEFYRELDDVKEVKIDKKEEKDGSK